jgi:hypothetical protein
MDLDLDVLMHEEGEWRDDALRSLTLIASLDTLDAGREMLKVLGRALELAREDIDLHPVRDNADVSRDLVYQLGGNRKIVEIRNLPSQARAILTRLKAELAEKGART